MQVSVIQPTHLKDHPPILCPPPPPKTVPPLSVKLKPDVKTLLRLQSPQTVLLIGFPRH